MNKVSTVLHHYLGICLVIVVAYFFVLGPTLDWLARHPSHQPETVSVQPTPATVTTRSVDAVVTASKDKAIISALQGRIIQLSASQTTIATALQHLGVSQKMAAAGAEGLTRPHPASQVISVSTSAKVSSPPAAASDDQIERSMKKVLKDTVVRTDNHVSVSWQDRPESPIFAAYSTDGSSGIGYTVKKAPALDLDALFMVTNNSMRFGAGVEHPIRGTAGGIGLNALVDSHTHSPSVNVYFAVHN